MQALLNGPQTNGVPDAYVPATKLSILSSAAVAQCAGQDGGVPTDNFLNDPRDCRFDPASVQCRAGQDPSTCLTAAQVEAVKKIYRGPHDSSGRLLFPGYEPGVESNPSNWPLWIVGASSASPGLQWTFSIGFWADEVFENPAFNPLTVNFDSDYRFALAKVAPVVSSTNPDLRPFERRGGKLIQYAGWADSAIAPMNGINYYNRVRDVLRGKRHGGDDDDSLEELRDFYRVFMVPGMAHCSGGEGPNAFGNGVNGPVVDEQHDLLRALEAWVEHGVAPRKIIGTHYLNNSPASGVQFQRPLCPFPEVARYKGGDPAQASSFVCVRDERDDDPRNQ
jgi:feruloyl esterase